MTLYVSDLDGTLLRSDEKTSRYSCEVINLLTSKGMLFAYATARSLVTAKKVTAGLDAKIPLIIYNGAFIVDNRSGEILKANYFDEGVNALLDRLTEEKIYPIVYAYIDGQEKFSYVPSLANEGQQVFTDTRRGDVRENRIDSMEDLKKGDIFYITCIDEPGKLEPLYEEYKDIYHCVYQRDIYTGDQWLEIMPREASKANAVKQLKEMFGCNRVVAYGDGRNDIDMFEVADEGYAVANADEDLKKAATGIIRSNNEDGVARHLMEQNGVALRLAERDDIQKIWEMQVEGFSDILTKYQDYDTNPAAESADRIEARYDMPGSFYYLIEAGGADVGVIRIVDAGDGSPKRISPLWIMPGYRGRGYAQMAMIEAERICGPDNWSLDTILQEKGNLYLYEKMGYRRVGGTEKINDKMDIVFYKKD